MEKHLNSVGIGLTSNQTNPIYPSLVGTNRGSKKGWSTCVWDTTHTPNLAGSNFSTSVPASNQVTDYIMLMSFYSRNPVP